MRDRTRVALLLSSGAHRTVGFHTAWILQAHGAERGLIGRRLGNASSLPTGVGGPVSIHRRRQTG
jgi:hypothetical protein